MSIWSSMSLVHGIDEVTADGPCGQPVTVDVAIAYGDEIRLALWGDGVDEAVTMDRSNVDRIIAQLAAARETMDG